MSAPSGIKVPPEISAAFADAQRDADNVRAVVFTIDGDSFTHSTTLAPQGSYDDDVALLQGALATPASPASFAYRLDSKAAGAYEWMMITFVPDEANVRAKMLQASSRSGLMKALGAGNFKHDWFATSTKDLTPRALKAHLDHMASPAPLTASEAALMEIKAAEAEEAKRVALDPTVTEARRKAVVGLGGKTQWLDGVAEALDKVADRSDDGWIVALQINAQNTAAIELLTSEACRPEELASKLPEKAPAYVFYSYPTPPPPKPAPAPAPASAAPAVARNMFQATAGGARPVESNEAPRWDAKEDDKTEEKEVKEEQPEGETEAEAEAEAPAADANAEPNAEVQPEGGAETEVAEKEAETEAAEEVAAMKLNTPPKAESPPPPSKGRVVFIYWCPSGSPVKFRMVYSTTVRGMQQDAMNKAGVDIVGKLETSDKSDLAAVHLKEAVPTGRTRSGNTLPGAAPVFGAPAPAGFGAAPSHAEVSAPRPRGAFRPPGAVPVFGAPAPIGMRTRSTDSDSASGYNSGSGANSAITSPAADDDPDRVANAFNAFGPRVGGGGGFARPKPAGRR